MPRYSSPRALIRILIALPLVVVGYSCDELPNEIRVSDIPSYYFDNQYLDKKITEIKKAIEESNGEYDSFIWITDIHWEPGLNTRNSPLLIKYIADKTGIAKVLNGGDTANSQVLCRNAIDQLKKAIGTSKVYTVTGNHEINDASRYERPFERVADELRGNIPNIVYGDPNKSYFYVDDYLNQIRYIGLSSFGLFLHNNYETCYNKEQLAWFQSVLNVNSGWTIVVFTHTLYNIDIASDKLTTDIPGGTDFIEVIDNYQGKGKIACVLMGHTHRDRMHVGKSGVPYIITASDRHATYYGDINVDRVPGTISEQHFEVVVINKERRTIKLFPIGAKARDGYDDTPGIEVDVRTVNY